jgi:hypothetical protein
MDANRKRIPATSARRSGNQKRFWRDPVTRAAGMSESCNEKTSTMEGINPLNASLQSLTV